MHTRFDNLCLFCNVQTDPSVHIIVLIKQIDMIDHLWPVTQNLSVVLKNLIFAIEVCRYVYATMFSFIDHLTWEEINYIKAFRFMSSASVSHK